jgi:hypothetical protein
MSSTQTYILNNTAIVFKPLRHDRTFLYANIKVSDIITLKVFFNTDSDVDNNVDSNVDSFPFEVQIFRGECNVNDTPFPHRKFMKDISQVDQYVILVQEWALKAAGINFHHILSQPYKALKIPIISYTFSLDNVLECDGKFNGESFLNLKFIDNNNVVISNLHPEFPKVICNLKITKRPKSNYYDIGYFEVNSEDNTVDPPYSQLKFGYCEKDDVTYYMRWFAQWFQHYHEAASQGFIIKGYKGRNRRDSLDPYLSWISDWKQF